MPDSKIPGRLMTDEDLFALLFAVYHGGTQEGLEHVPINLFFIREMLFRLNPVSSVPPPIKFRWSNN